MDEKQQAEEPKMTEELFAQHLNGLVRTTLLDGVRFKDVISTMVIATDDVVQIMREQQAMEQMEQRPRILVPGNIDLPPE